MIDLVHVVILTRSSLTMERFIEGFLCYFCFLGIKEHGNSFRMSSLIVRFAVA